VQSAPKAQAVVAVQNSNATNEKKAPRAMTAVGHRDPFQSPVVSMGAMGSGCSSGKRCLAIDQIALRCSEVGQRNDRGSSERDGQGLFLA
jgi:hypothetical protein